MSDNWKKVAPDNWRARRWVVFASLAYAALTVIYIVIKGEDSALYRDVAVALIGASVAIIGSYVFGAVWDDRSKRRDFRSIPRDGGDA